MSACKNLKKLMHFEWTPSLFYEYYFEHEAIAEPFRPDKDQRFLKSKVLSQKTSEKFMKKTKRIFITFKVTPIIMSSTETLCFLMNY